MAEHKRPEEWLPLVHEDVIEPDLPIVDPHHHLWDYRDRPGYQPVYVLDELHEDTGSGHRVEQTVFVECSWAYRTDGPSEFAPVGETEFVAGVARASAERTGQARIAAIVGSCDLAMGHQLDAVLDAHKAAGGTLFRGIRHRLAVDPTGSARTSRVEPNTPDLMTTDEFRAGVARLGERGESFEAWIYHPQLAQLVDMAAAVSGTTIILNHIGAPLGVGAYAGKRAEVLAEWRDGIAALSERPNVVVKLGGIGMPVYGCGYDQRERPATSDEIVADWGDEIRFIIDRFGPGRCMFESNFPVDKVSVSYRVLWNAFKKMTSDLGAAERADLFAGTARRVYRLD
jgi:predicted TIM-barrel fold metal-dependent hydrolase